MKKLILVILLLISSVYSEQTVTEKCHMEGVYKVCGKKSTLLLQCKGCAWTTYGEYDLPSEQLSVIVRLAEDAQGPYTDEYFILDYKNMMVYDKGCLGGNNVLVDPQDGKLYYFSNKKEDFSLFNKQDFEHCKQPLDKWLKKPYKPYP